MIRPRRLGHHGSVVATGFVVDPALIGVAEARRRILDVWAPGAVVVEHAGLLAITGLRARRVRAALAPGAPLVEQHGVVAAAPLDPDEAEVLAPHAGPQTFVRVADGVAENVRAPAVDITAWVDLDDLAIAEVAPLAAPPAGAAIPVPATIDLRQVAGVGATAAGARELRDALLGSGVAVPARPSLLQRVVRWLSVRIAPPPAALPARTGGPARPTWLARLRDRFALALWRSRVGSALGRRHAAYLRRMLEMFDRGELDAALRHAIPVGGGGGDPRLGLMPPRPRKDLQLSLTAPGGRATIPVAETAEQMIRGRYQAAAARLEQQGRIDDAAFVLADLLGDVDGAIALLERHDRHALAARLAEGRGQPPGMVVRLWFLAGDVERAIDVARVHGAWADAIARLERSRDGRAAGLRMAWAEHLAAAGDYPQAVELAASLPAARDRVLAWIDRGIAAEGNAGARLLVKKLALAPATFPSVAPAIVEILDDPDPDAAWRRLALVETLVASPASTELRTIGRAAVRALIGDVGRGADGDAPTVLPRLVRFADDAALRADQPAIAASPRTPPLVDRGAPVSRRWTVADAGAVPVHDAAVLAGGRMLIALGELGVRVLARDGRTIAHLDQPATRLVVSDHGTRALALARRGDAMRIARIAPIERRAVHWCDAQCDGGAATFDGGMWLASRGSEVLAIDTTAPRWKAIWGVDLSTRDPVTCTISRDGDLFAIEATESFATTGELWFYERLTLRHRAIWQPPPRDGSTNEIFRVAARPSSRDAIAVGWSWPPPPMPRARLVSAEWSLPLGPGFPGPVEVDTRVATVALHDPDAGCITVTAVHLARRVVLATLTLDGATAATLRLGNGTATVGDDRGRVIVLDLRTGALRRDLRIGA